jgi:CheY-like chemotaxis protein
VLHSRKFDVGFCDSATEAVERIRNDVEVHAIVLDIQMPPPPCLSVQATNNGMDTGLWLILEIRELIISRPLPVAILSNRVPKGLKTSIAQMGFPEQFIEVYHKVDTSAESLGIRLGIMLDRWRGYRS